MTLHILQWIFEDIAVRSATDVRARLDHASYPTTLRSRMLRYRGIKCLHMFIVKLVPGFDDYAVSVNAQALDEKSIGTAAELH